MPTNFTIKYLEFSSRSRSVYSENFDPVLGNEKAFTFDWDVNPDVAIREGLGEVIIIPRVQIKIFGKRVTIIPEVKVDFDTEFTFDFDSFGELGIQFGYRLDTGSVDTDLSYQPTATFSEDLRYNANTSTQVLAPADGLANAGAFDVNPFGLNAYVDFLCQFGLLIDASLRLFGWNALPERFPALDFEIPEDVPSLPTDETETGPDGDPLGNIRLINLTNDKIQLLEFVFGDILDTVIPDLGDNFSTGIDGSSYIFTVDFFTRLDLSLDVDPYRGEFELNLGDVKNKDIQFSGIDTGAPKDPNDPSKGNVKVGPVFTYDIFDVVFSIPSPRPKDDTLDANLLEGSDAADVLVPRIDLDGLVAYAVTYATKLPIATDYNLKVSDLVSFDITLLDVDAGLPDLRLRQDIEITPNEVSASVLFTDVNGTALDVTYTQADGTVVSDSEWSGVWSEFPDLTLTQATVITPTFTTGASLMQETGPEIGAGLNVDIGVLQAGVKAPKGVPFVGGDTLFKIKLGPLFEIDFTEDDIIRFINNLAPGNPIPPDFNFFPISPGTINLGGFNSIAGVPYVLDVENTIDPGLSGFDVTDDDGNKIFVYDPVAADIAAFTPDVPIQIFEGETLELDVNDILALAYDLDAFDTLILTAVGDPIDDTTTSVRGAATLRDDGVIVFDTNGEFEALGVDEFGAPEASLGTSISLEYTISDSVGRTDTGTLTISVLGENDLPVAVDDYYSVEVVNGTVFLDDGLFGFLDNDIEIDIEDVLRNDEEDVTTSLGATVSLFASNSFLYDTDNLPSIITDLAPGEVVFDTFNYTVRDRVTSDTDEGVVGTITVAFIGAEDDVTPPLQDLAVNTNAISLIEGEETGSFAFVLSAQPTSDVTVDLTFGDTSEFTLDKSQLVFTSSNWFVPNVVTVTPLDDGIVDGTQTVTVTASVTSADDADAFLGDTQTIDVTVEDAAAIIASTRRSPSVRTARPAPSPSRCRVNRRRAPRWCSTWSGATMPPRPSPRPR